MDNVFITRPRGDRWFTISETLIAPPAGTTDTVHLSNCSDFTIANTEILGGSEDCIDLNNECSHATIEGCVLQSGGKYCMTIKGGTAGITIQNVTINGHGSEADIDIGNWSDQSNKLTRDILLINVTSLDKKPVVVRVLWAEHITAHGGNVKFVGIIPFVGTGKLNLAIVWLWRLGRKYGLWGK